MDKELKEYLDKILKNQEKIIKMLSQTDNIIDLNHKESRKDIETNVKSFKRRDDDLKQDLS